jgi:hypothetical protein
MTQHTETVKATIDGLSIVTAFATLFEILPAIAALFSIVWTGMRIVEMVTGRTMSEILGTQKDK